MWGEVGRRSSHNENPVALRRPLPAAYQSPPALRVASPDNPVVQAVFHQRLPRTVAKRR